MTVIVWSKSYKIAWIEKKQTGKLYESKFNAFFKVTLIANVDVYKAPKTLTSKCMKQEILNWHTNKRRNKQESEIRESRTQAGDTKQTYE